MKYIIFIYTAVIIREKHPKNIYSKFTTLLKAVVIHIVYKHG